MLWCLSRPSREERKQNDTFKRIPSFQPNKPQRKHPPNKSPWTKLLPHKTRRPTKFLPLETPFIYMESPNRSSHDPNVLRRPTLPHDPTQLPHQAVLLNHQTQPSHDPAFR